MKVLLLIAAAVLYSPLWGIGLILKFIGTALMLDPRKAWKELKTPFEIKQNIYFTEAEQKEIENQIKKEYRL